jgi:hypothetical protein
MAGQRPRDYNRTLPGSGFQESDCESFYNRRRLGVSRLLGVFYIAAVWRPRLIQPERAAVNLKYAMTLTVDIRALPSCAAMMHSVNTFMHECGFNETLVAFIPLTEIIVTVNREMLAEELRAVFGAAQAMAEKLSEETGNKYKVEEPRLIS